MIIIMGIITETLRYDSRDGSRAEHGAGAAGRTTAVEVAPHGILHPPKHQVELHDREASGHEPRPLKDLDQPREHRLEGVLCQTHRGKKRERRGGGLAHSDTP